MKQKFISLGLALAMLLGVAGCNVTTPAAVGSIGGVEIPAGIYLLAQYNAYNTTAALVDFATGETAADLDAVLDAEVTGTINGEQVTTDGADYISRLTMAAIEYYAAAEVLFDELGATLEDAATAEAADTAASMWNTNSEVYAANGIGQATLQAYVRNAAKAQACLQALYGPDGQQPVTDAEYEDFIENECLYIESVTLPMVDYTTYTYAFTDETMTQAIGKSAEDCAAYLAEYAPADATGAEAYAAMYAAAEQYVPQAMAAMGATMESAQAAGYVGAGLYLPDDLLAYASSEEENVLADPLRAAGAGEWVTVDLTTSMVVARCIDPLARGTLEDYRAGYDLLGAMKSDELQARLYADGAAMEHALDQAALDTYTVRNVKYSV